METFYAKGFSLRKKLTLIIGGICLLFISVQAMNAYQMAGLAQTAERTARVAVATDQTAQAIDARYQALRQAVEQQHRREQLRFLALTLIAVAAVIGLYYYLHRTLFQPLTRLVEAMQRLADGDLTVSIQVHPSQRDEIAQASGMLNILADNLSDSVGQVGRSTEAIALGAQELSGATEQMSSSAQEQASSLEETAASMEEMTSTVKHNADNAVQVDKLASEAAAAASESMVMATSLQRSMDMINRSSDKIADIIGVIDEIAFQTNLLALNAAVEAARAGEHGRGFAVVAAEVRNLAQRSAQAAKEIKALINDSVEKAGDGAHLVGIAGTKLEGIVGKIKHVAELISEINASSQEQASGIEQVNRAIVQMDSVTQSNAAQVEELSSTSQSLAAQADQLRDLVARFKLPEHAMLAATASVKRSAPKALVGADKPTLETAPATAPTRARRAAGGRAAGDWTEF